MKKVVFGGVVVAVVVVAIVTALLITHKKAASPESKTSTAKVTDYSPKKACDAVTLDNAKAVLGAEAKASNGSGIGIGDTASDDIMVSTCTYSAGNQSASVLLRSAKSAAGATSNKSIFSTQKPAGVQDVSGYGQAAFWDARYGQLNILKGNDWIIVSVGGFKPTDKTLDDAKKLASQFLSNL